MSIKIMARIWDRGPEKQADRFVMLALADYANDAGECWPAMQSVAEKCCMTERGVQKVVRRLEDAGWVSVETGGGRHGCNKYTLYPEPRSGFCDMKTLNNVHPEHSSPPNDSAKTPNLDTENPEHGSPEPSGTIKNHQSNSSACEEISDDDLLSEVWNAVGIRGPRIPTYWLPPGATIHVSRWRSDLNLTAGQIIEAASQSRSQHDQAPSGPKALDRLMQNIAGNLSAPPLSPSKPRLGKSQVETDAQKLGRWKRIANA